MADWSLICIPARGGSTRIPRKNLEKVGVFNLIEIAAQCARGCAEIGQFVVSTDDAFTYRELYDDGFGRNELHARRIFGDGPMAPVLLDAAEGWSRPPQTVICLQPTSPLRTSEDVRAAYEMFLARDRGRSLVSVNADTGQRNGAIYITRVEMLRDGLVFDDDSLKYPMPAARSLDINEPSDLEEARRILGP